MKIVLQLVKEASVVVEQKTVGQINAQGFLLLVGVENSDTEKEADLVIDKILNLRTFYNPETKKYFDVSLLEVGGETLIVSQFTIPATFKKGRRPEFSGAMNPKDAEKLYDYFVAAYKDKAAGLKVETGIFGAEMEVSLINDGPITYIFDSSDFN